MGDEDKKRQTKSDNPDAPLRDPKVDVKVKPVEHRVSRDQPREVRENRGRQNNQNDKKADKIAEGLEREVREAVKQNESGGKKKQLDAAKEAGERVAQDQPPGQIEEITITVDGNKSTHRPGENGPKK